jgi:hypothetical protein
MKVIVLFFSVQLIEQEPSIYMTNATRDYVRRDKIDVLGKDFLGHEEVCI